MRPAPYNIYRNEDGTYTTAVTTDLAYAKGVNTPLAVIGSLTVFARAHKAPDVSALPEGWAPGIYQGLPPWLRQPAPEPLPETPPVGAKLDLDPVTHEYKMEEAFNGSDEHHNF